MDSERLFWGYLPMAISLIGIAASLYALVRDFSVAQILFSLPVVVSLSFALILLINMARGAWPTYVPHLLIGFIYPVVVGQGLTARRNRASEREVRLPES